MATKILNGLDLASQKIVNQADPTNPQDSATKNYVDNKVNGLGWQQPVRVASTTDVTISGPGANVDGVAMVSGERILLTAQGTASQNGPWIWNGAASALTRPTDYTGSIPAKSAYTVLVLEGTSADKAYTLQTDTAITVNTTATAWVPVGGGTSYLAGSGLSLSGSTFNIGAADGSITVNADDITVGNVPVSKGGTGGTTAATARSGIGAVGRYANTVTTAAATPLTVNHALNSRDVTVALYDAASGTANQVIPDVAITDANNITITTAAICTNYRVVVIG